METYKILVAYLDANGGVGRSIEYPKWDQPYPSEDDISRLENELGVVVLSVTVLSW